MAGTGNWHLRHRCLGTKGCEEGDLPGRAPRLSNLLRVRQKAPRRSPSPLRARACAAASPGVALRCGVRAGRRPEPSAAWERDAVPGLPRFVAGAGARRIYDSVHPGRKRTEPPPRCGLQSPGVRRREESDPRHCRAPSRPAPASGRRRPHEDPPAGAENRALPGPRSCRGLRTLDRSVRWRARRPRCGQERRPPGPVHRARGATRPPEGHRGRAPASAGATQCLP